MNEEDVPIPWKLSFELDDVARKYSWFPIGRVVSANEIAIIYKPRKRSTEDQIPQMIEDLP